MRHYVAAFLAAVFTLASAGDASQEQSLDDARKAMLDILDQIVKVPPSKEEVDRFDADMAARIAKLSRKSTARFANTSIPRR